MDTRPFALSRSGLNSGRNLARSSDELGNNLREIPCQRLAGLCDQIDVVFLPERKAAEGDKERELGGAPAWRWQLRRSLSTQAARV
jgi:hypothetical protein